MRPEPRGLPFVPPESVRQPARTLAAVAEGRFDAEPSPCASAPGPRNGSAAVERRVPRTAVLEEGLDRVLKVLRPEQRARDLAAPLVGAPPTVLEEGTHHPPRRGVGERRAFGEIPRELDRLVPQLAVRIDAVDHVPALERGGVVEAAAHHEFARPGGPRALRHALRAAAARRQPDHALD